ncbi:hypothetical protein MIND_00065400 [Mycena indigotica]|uniref:Peroxisomal targeting signal receptor n=1 Tax=Mycena indigotica TaxID=2126181 RepID=A0A8H6TDP1_9AGAR|nr:uncharacterized protein MIND_00065400 [Mycena indigotica]KAF7315501.1 hypothetical protein MIND_00065400 [Mycena indigotica]
MALPLLVNNADCGPSNPLQGLSKRFDQDRGIQQDHFAANRAGSSRETFRTQQSVQSDIAQDAARFFGPQLPTQLTHPNAFDLSALHASLPQQSQAHAPAAWASDFMLTVTPQINTPREIATPTTMLQSRGGQQQPQQQQQWGPRFSQYPMPMFNSAMAMQPVSHSQPSTQHDQIIWDREFDAAMLQEAPQVQDMKQITQDADELARTAGILLETVGEVANPKFKNSEFMGLMRGLRDRDIVVEGNDMVKNTGQTSIDVKGKGRAVNLPVVDPSSSMPFRYQQLEQQQRPVEGLKVEEEDPNEAYFRQENIEYQYYWAEANAARAKQASTSQQNEWEHLQQDWDNFEATNAGIVPVDRYRFQPNNPYLSSSATTRHHLAHHGREAFLESVLELEAVVQRNMNDASAWYDLGVKQQANEREHQALQALQRAVDLDPTHLPSWLALAVSHTNNGDRTETAAAIRQWVDRNDRYRDAVQQFRANTTERADAPMQERFGNLIQCLIAMARSDTSGEIDADIQIALAVLLNSNEASYSRLPVLQPLTRACQDYEKAQDCFRTALAVRPDDWLLYNRVGATMANSGRAEEALEYYNRALELNPLYIRARFNLGISCINLRRFDDAAHHILDALGLQESDGVASSMDASGGVTNTALWDSLRTVSMNLQRPDLAILCDARDLDGYRKSFRG